MAANSQANSASVRLALLAARPRMNQFIGCRTSAKPAPPVSQTSRRAGLRFAAMLELGGARGWPDATGRLSTATKPSLTIRVLIRLNFSGSGFACGCVAFSSSCWLCWRSPPARGRRRAMPRRRRLVQLRARRADVRRAAAAVLRGAPRGAGRAGRRDLRGRALHARQRRQAPHRGVRPGRAVQQLHRRRRRRT